MVGQVWGRSTSEQLLASDYDRLRHSSPGSRVTPPPASSPPASPLQRQATGQSLSSGSGWRSVLHPGSRPARLAPVHLQEDRTAFHTGGLQPCPDVLKGGLAQIQEQHSFPSLSARKFTADGDQRLTSSRFGSSQSPSVTTKTEVDTLVSYLDRKVTCLGRPHLDHRQPASRRH